MLFDYCLDGSSILPDSTNWSRV